MSVVNDRIPFECPNCRRSFKQETNYRAHFWCRKADEIIQQEARAAAEARVRQETAAAAARMIFSARSDTPTWRSPVSHAPSEAPPPDSAVVRWTSPQQDEEEDLRAAATAAAENGATAALLPQNSVNVHASEAATHRSRQVSSAAAAEDVDFPENAPSVPDDGPGRCAIL